MRSPRLNKVSKALITVTLLFSFSAHSDEEKKEAPKEAAKEGGEEGGKVEGPGSKEWREEEGRIQKVQSQIEKSKGEIDELFEARAKSTDPAEVVKLGRDILTKSEEMKTQYAEYRKLQLHIRFKHPEKGDFTERKYEREEAFVPQDNSFELSMQGRLDRIKSNFAAHYSVPPKKIIESGEATRVPASESDEPKRIVLAK